jgi:tetratricopeptide (TPR) repeat protein
VLDAQEYLHLAIKSSREGLHQQALEQLHKCLDIDPTNATATFLLAAEHAELGMFDRAIKGMESALQLDAGLEMARLQLGMLYARQGENNQAINMWRALADRTEDPALTLFAQGFTLLCEGETQRGVELLKEGAQKNVNNAALNTSINDVIHGVQGGSSPSSKDKQRDKSDSLYLGAYSNSAIGNQE